MLAIYENYYYKNSNQEFKLFSNLEHNWYLYSDTEVEETIQNIMRGLKENKYDPGIYANILNTLIELYEIGFQEEYINQAFLIMQHNISLLTEHIYLYRGINLGDKRKINTEYVYIMHELQEKIDIRFEKAAIETIERFMLEEDGWAVNLFTYVQKNRRGLIEEIGFLSQLDETKLFEKLEKSKSHDLHAFKSCISSLYEKDSIGKALRCDKEKLIKLKEYIERLDRSKFDKIQKMNMSRLVKDIELVILLYKSDQTVSSETS